jgi:hypothetical protein
MSGRFSRRLLNPAPLSFKPPRWGLPSNGARTILNGVGRMFHIDLPIISNFSADLQAVFRLLENEEDLRTYCAVLPRFLFSSKTR